PAKYQRLPPRSTARRHPEPCASAALFALAARRLGESAEPETARSATLHRANTFFDLGSRSRPPCSFQHNRYGERAGTAARHSNVRRRSEDFILRNKERVPENLPARRRRAS